MRVLYIGMSNIYGGIERFCDNYSEALKSKGIYCDYICTQDRIAFEDKIKKRKGKVYKINNFKTHPLKYLYQLVKIVKKYKVVHINMLSAANILPVIACKIGRVEKVIIHSHNSQTDSRIKRVLHYINKPVVNWLATDYLACSKVAAKWLFTKKIIRNKKYVVIVNTIKCEDYRFNPEWKKELSEQYNVSDKFVVGFVGRLTAQKNCLFLLEVMNEVFKKHKNIVLFMVGKGEQEEEIRYKIEKYNISDKVYMLGERRDVNRFYSLFDLFVMPSLYEGFGFTAIEAQVSGVTCFFSPNIPSEALLRKADNYIISTDRTSVWADKILKTSKLRNSSDRNSVNYKECFEGEVLKLFNSYTNKGHKKI